MDKNKICFIIYHTPSGSPDDCISSLNGIEIPEGFTAQLMEITEEPSILKGFEEAMGLSDAKYKVYLTDVIKLQEPKLMKSALRLFEDPSVGMIGVVGTARLSKDGVIRHSQCMGCIDTDAAYQENDSICRLQPVEEACADAEAVEGYLLVTQYDVPWGDARNVPAAFFSTAQSFHFRLRGLRVVVPRQDRPWCRCSSLDYFQKETEEERQLLLNAYPEVFRAKAWVRAAHFYSDQIGILDWAFAFLGSGQEVDSPDFPVSLTVKSAEEVKKIREYLQRMHVDMALTYDFSPNVAEACFQEKLPYISWVYDAPLPELYTLAAGYDTNRIFLFDRAELQRLSKGGNAQRLYHMPLAAEGGLPEIVIREEERQFYESDISFVGKLYADGTGDEIFRQAGADLKRQWNQLTAPSCVWGDGKSVFGSASEELTEFAAQMLVPRPSERFFMSDSHYVEAMLLARKRNENERRAVLNRLAEKFHTVFYTNDSPNGLIGVEIRRGVDYFEELPGVYAHSKINLNITSRSIETGIPQRVFDILRCGGFLLMNYQEEIEELFQVGVDLEVFHNLEELEAKAEYYLKHEKERRAIALQGQRKVLERHTYEARLPELLSRLK